MERNLEICYNQASDAGEPRREFLYKTRAAVVLRRRKLKNEVFPMLFHEELIQHRKEKGMTQEELSERLSVSRQTVSKWENGECMPDADKFIRLADILEISLDELAGREVEVKPIVLPAPELPKPGKRLPRLLAASAACLILALGGFALGRWVLPAQTEPAAVQPLLPQTLTVRDLKFFHRQVDEWAELEEWEVACSFVSNVSVDGTLYLYQEEKDSEPTAVPVRYENGVQRSGVLPRGVFSRAVFVITADGQERSVLLATDIEITAGSYGYIPAEE